jgi:outer membrane protein assembly factor BamB
MKIICMKDLNIFYSIITCILGGKIMQKNIFTIGVLFFLTVSAITPMTLEYNNIIFNKVTKINDYNYDRYLFPEYYNCYNVDEIPKSLNQPNREISDNENIVSETVTNPVSSSLSLDGLMNSPWPMYCYDIRHTGRSPYSTINTPGDEKWKFWTELSGIQSGIVISDDGTIYFGGSYDLYAAYPNGTLKWRYDTGGVIESSPAIDVNGVIYIGTISAVSGNYLYAFYPNGTLKWKYYVGDWIASSPTIGEDGTIYFGSEDDYIYALYPNGTLKWKYLTSVAVYSSPAIGDDGTVYCGSHDGNLYALYPNNGTLKWKYQTGDLVARGPSVADDGTIYFGSWDGYLYAVYPDGSLKWKTGGHLAGTTPVTAQDGTIYVGNRYLSAIYPNNGSVKWTFNPGPDRFIQGGNPCISAEGTIYFGTSDGGEIIAINSDGTERWRKNIGTVHSAPAIGSDGTVYIGTMGINDGYLYAFGPLDPNAPTAPKINGQTSIKPRRSYEYTFKSTSPLGRGVFYYIDWGDNTVEDWFGPYSSGEELKVSHSWSKRGTYIINARAKDSENLWGPWGKLKVTTPKSKVVNFNSLLLKLVEKFPLLEQLLYLIK